RLLQLLCAKEEWLRRLSEGDLGLKDSELKCSNGIAGSGWILEGCWCSVLRAERSLQAYHSEQGEPNGGATVMRSVAGYRHGSHCCSKPLLLLRTARGERGVNRQPCMLKSILGWADREGQAKMWEAGR